MPGQRGSETRIRQHLVQVRMDDGELARLDSIVEGTALTRAEVLRRLTCRATFQSVETDRIVTHLSRIGNNLNQLARVANATGQLRDHQILQDSLSQLADVVREID